ncbi:NADPH:quinone oxidoreductase family protein [Paracoccus aminophilus]|uniref:NADPH2:quinone reductase n=1 Tax=Paracoccus aminophilus JCM 7686 TaxID=1367847 RepID=S5XME0_PARAH|nr:NADPH:quinone oxidoreductase family protein [Paracoccus aminophilus]AGT08464.1 NADPH2:quinone reductase [Paracoccus aminophilus JCM 7686]
MPKNWSAMRIETAGARPVAASLPARTPGPKEVLVQMKAAALNFADLLMAGGSYQETPPLPFVPGLEGAGEVIAAGEDVDLAPGTRVAISAQGTMAEYGIFRASDCLPIPARLSYAAAAGFQIAYGTSHLALTARAGLRAGETLAVLGAAGGVGLTAVEIGAALGARVIAIARGADKLEAAAAAGAHELIDSATCPDLKAALRALGGVDVVYDPVGDAPGEAAFAALRPGGRFLVIGFAGGKPPKLPLNHALVKNIAIHGFYWGGYLKLAPELLRDSMTQLFDLVEKGLLHPHTGASYPLDRLPEAYDLLESRKSIGKVIVEI